jgi:hypothetical protein
VLTVQRPATFILLKIAGVARSYRYFATRRWEVDEYEVEPCGVNSPKQFLNML